MPQQPIRENMSQALPALRPLTREELSARFAREVAAFFLDPSEHNEVPLDNMYEYLKRAARMENNPHLNAVANKIIVPLNFLKAYAQAVFFDDEEYFAATHTALAHITQAAKAAVTPDEWAALRDSDEVQERIATMSLVAVLGEAPLAEFFCEPEQTEALVETINHHLKVLGVITRLVEARLGNSFDLEGDDIRRLDRVDNEPRLNKPYHDDDGLSR